MVGVVRVVTSDDTEFLDRHGRLLESEQGLRTLTRCLPDQPRGVFDDATFAAAVPKVRDLAVELAGQVDVVVISCAADPGLAEARAAVDVPVVGAGSAAAGLALALGRRVGVLDLTARTPESITSVLGSRLHLARQPDGVRETRDLLTEQGRVACLTAARRMVEDGADVLLQACTGMTTTGLAAQLRRELRVPVVDAVRAAGTVAALAA
ncbi:aspartate/glutamate racemase family protein [Kineococcus deserti]